MDQMLAVQYDAYGPPEVLHTRRLPVPEIRPGHVLIRVAASSVNGADLAVRAGKLKLVTGRAFPRGAGFDVAGTITAVADDVTALAVGDEVWGFVGPSRHGGPSGTAAEYVLIPATGVALRPHGIGPVEAAGLSAVGASALGVLRDHLRVQPGDRVLVRGANGGVGTAAVQIARALGGTVTALASAPHLDRLRDLGAHDAFDYHTTSPADLGQFDAIIDPVSRHMRLYRQMLAPGGRMAAMALGAPSDLAYLATSTVHGRRRVRFVQSPATGRLLADLTGFVDDKGVSPVIEAVYLLDDIVAAHHALERGGGFGKHVIAVA